MEDHDEAPEPAEGGTDEGTVPKSELQKAIAKRQALKAQNAELTAKLAEYEAKEREAEQKRLRDAEDWGELEKQLSAERDAARTELESFRSKIRRSALLDAVAKATGKEAARADLEILMLGVEARGTHKDLDWAPEDLNEKAIDRVVRTLKKEVPAFFATQARGGTPGAIGQPVPVGERDDEYYRQMGKRHSFARPRGPTTMG